MTTKLRKFQKAGVKMIAGFDYRALLADEMGLGKTIQALTAFQQSGATLGLVICPATLKLLWQNQARLHCDLNSVILYGLTPYPFKMKKRPSLIIINYDILAAWRKKLAKFPIDFVIIDEAHLLANLHTKRTRASRKLCSTQTKIVALSGTPMTSRVWELFPICNILFPDEFDSPFSFGMRYCRASKPYGKFKFSGARNLGELNRRLVNLGMIRRTKAEVLPELPPKTRTVIPFELPSYKEYNLAEKDLIKWLSGFDLERANNAARAERMVKFGYLLRLAAKLKLDTVIEWIDNLMEEADGKVLVGAIHRHKEPIIPRLFEHYQDIAVQIHGGISSKGRAEAEDRFQDEDRIQMLIGQMKSVGLGLNLTAASHVVVCELPWTPGVCEQFENRPHRLTSKHPVFVYFLIAANTIEEHLCELLQRKQRVINKVLDGKATRAGTLDIFDLLQKGLEKKYRNER